MLGFMHQDGGSMHHQRHATLRVPVPGMRLRFTKVERAPLWGVGKCSVSCLAVPEKPWPPNGACAHAHHTQAAPHLVQGINKAVILGMVDQMLANKVLVSLFGKCS